MTNRLTVALVHLALGLLIILGTAGLMALYFYPGVFRDIEDIADLLAIIIPVDIIIGPMLTLIVFKPGKKGLKLDLLLIALCQLSALAYGCWTIYQTRPGYLVFSYDTFYLAPPGINQQGLPKTHRASLQVGVLGQPKVVQSFIDLPAAEQMALAQASMAKGTPLQFDSRFFRPFTLIDSKTLLKHSIPVAKLREKSDASGHEQLERLQAAYQNLAFIPVINDRVTKVVAIDVDSRELLAVINPAD